MSSVEAASPWQPWQTCDLTLRMLSCSLCLRQVQMAVDVRFAQDTLRGDNVTEIRMKFIKRIEENLPAGDE